MKLTIVLLIATCLQANAKVYSQKITLKENNISLQKVFEEIRKQTGYQFLYADEVLNTAKKVSINIEQESVEKVLDFCFKDQQLSYIISGNTIIVKKAVIVLKPNVLPISPPSFSSPIFIKESEHLINADEIREKLVNNAIQIKGKVINSNGEPLAGVSITVKGTNNGTSTDETGAYSITTNSGNGILVFSYVGYRTQEVSINGRLEIVIVMEASVSSLDQVIVIGYGTQKKESVVGAVANIKGDVLERRGGVTNLSSALSGQIPGVTVMESTGEPGRDVPQILIRGQSTWNGSQPLILVDGIERNMNDIDVTTVASVSVLKDASATAVFGVKGANGVILITTKRGYLGKPKLSFQAHQGVKTISKIPKLLDAYLAQKWKDAAIEHEVSANGSAWQYYIPDEVLQFYLKPQENPYTYLYPNVDWPDVLLKDLAANNKFNLNISGGTDIAKYFVSFGYSHEGDLFATHYNEAKGYDPGYKYDRFNFRSNLDFNLTKTTIFSVNIDGYIGRRQAPASNFGKSDGVGVTGSSDYTHVFGGIYTLAPDAFPIKYPDGNYGIDPANLNMVNPLALLQEGGTIVTNRRQIGTDFKLTQKLDFVVPGLSFSANMAWNNYVSSNGPSINDRGNQGQALFEYQNPSILNAKNRQDSINATTVIATGGSTGGINEFDFVMQPWTVSKEAINNGSLERALFYQAALNYAGKFNKHEVTGLLAFNRRQNASGSEFPHYREDWVGRVTYNYSSKYFMEVNGAYNGSEKFAPQYRFGFFPSAALGWMISNETFMRKFIWLDKFKLRASIGQVGSDAGIPRWGYIESWVSPGTGLDRSSQFYGSNGIIRQNSPYLGYREGAVPNPDIRWETATKRDIGIELSALQNIITFDMDIFNENRDNIFMSADQRNVPVYFGADPVSANIGATETNGYELTVGFNKYSAKGFGYMVSLSMTGAKDIVLKSEDPEGLPGYQKVAGFSISQTKSAIASAYMNNWDEVYASASASSDMNFRLPGDRDIVDYNGDGVINSFDVVPYGFPSRPQNTYSVTLGMNYKNFRVMVQFYAIANITISATTILPEVARWTAVSASLNDYWMPDNTSAFYKAPRLTTTSSNGQFSLYDGSYVRLKTAEIAYDFTGKWIKKLGISSAGIALTGNNLMFWSDLPMDTESKFDLGNSYPMMRQFDLGLNISF